MFFPHLFQLQSRLEWKTNIKVGTDMCVLHMGDMIAHNRTKVSFMNKYGNSFHLKSIDTVHSLKHSTVLSPYYCNIYICLLI